MTLNKLALAVVSLIAAPLLALLGSCSGGDDGGGGGGSTPVNAAGTWAVTVTTTAATGACAHEEGETQQDTVTIAQNGSDITLTPEGGSALTGTISGRTITIMDTETDADGTSTENVSLTLSADGNSMSGTNNWTFTSATDPSGNCTGTDSITGTRAQPAPACGMATAGTWSVDLVTAVGGFTMMQGTLTQSGCVVTIAQDVESLSGTVASDGTWTATITGTEFSNGQFTATFSASATGGPFDSLTVTGGTTGGENITGGTGMFEG